MKLSGAETYSFVWEWRTRAGTWKGVFVFSVDLRKPELLSLHFIGDTQIGKKKKKRREEIKCTNKCKIRHSPVILLSKGLLPWTSRCYHWDIPSNVIHIEITYYEDNQYLFTSFLFLSPSAWSITSTQHTHTKSPLHTVLPSQLTPWAEPVFSKAIPSHWALIPNSGGWSTSSPSLYQWMNSRTSHFCQQPAAYGKFRWAD